MRIILILLILSSCSFIDDTHFEIDEQVRPFVKNIRNQNLQIIFSNVIQERKVLAVTVWGEITRIELDYSLQEKIKSDPLFFETVLYHEIGHAVYGRDHCFDCYSLMNPNRYVSEYRMDSVKRMELKKELFK